MPLAGFLTTASQHYRFSLVWVIAIGTAGEVIGGFIGYGIGRFGGRPLLERYGKWIMISPHEIDVGSARFDKYGSWLVLVGRLLPAIRSYISIVAGMSEMDLRQFFIFSLIGSLAWCTVLTVLGHQLGNNWTSISAATRPYEVPIISRAGVSDRRLHRVPVFPGRGSPPGGTKSGRRRLADRRLAALSGAGNGSHHAGRWHSRPTCAGRLYPSVPRGG